MSVTLDDIKKAEKRIQPYIRHTDVTRMVYEGRELYIKLENLQITGAYKVRGAFNRMLQLSESERKKGVLAASAGNHAQGVALAAKTLGIKCTIVMPLNAPLQKIAATEGYGAKVVLFGATYDDACAHALELVEKTGAIFIHPFNDERVIAGQGTVALELLEDIHPGTVLVPVGGGGLASGIAVALKSIDPTIRVIGVEPASAASMSGSVKAGRIITLASSATIADGIAVKTPGSITFEMCRNYLDDIITVEDNLIASTILLLMEKSKIVSEGAGAAPVAAFIAGMKNEQPSERPTVAILSGGNIDATMLSRIIEKGLVWAGRKIILKTELSDKPGFLARLLTILSQTGANIVSIQHDRALPDTVTSAAVILELETRDMEHVREIKTLLSEEGYRLI